MHRVRVWRVVMAADKGEAVPRLKRGHAAAP
jgi:hypothetical protein